MKLKLKRDMDGHMTGKTARKFNYKNVKALGSKAVDSMIEAGATATLFKENFHRKLGGASKQPKKMRKNAHGIALEEEQDYEQALWEEEEALYARS